MILSVFDFDGTLRRPSGTWNAEVVDRARRAYGRGYSVLLTGQPESNRFAVTQALREHRIPFHKIETVGPLFTGTRKRAEIERLVRAIGPASVEVWDDQHDLLSSYGRLLDELGVPKKLYLVNR